MNQPRLNSSAPKSTVTFLALRRSTVFGMEREFLAFSLSSLLGLVLLGSLAMVRSTPGAAPSGRLHASTQAAPTAEQAA